MTEATKQQLPLTDPGKPVVPLATASPEAIGAALAKLGANASVAMGIMYRTERLRLPVKKAEDFVHFIPPFPNARMVAFNPLPGSGTLVGSGPEVLVTWEMMVPLQAIAREFGVGTGGGPTAQNPAAGVPKTES